MKLSNCHNAPVTIGGIGDFDDRDRVSTQYYVCSECSKPCNLADTEDNWLIPLLVSLVATGKFVGEGASNQDLGTPVKEVAKQITRRMEQEKLEARISELEQAWDWAVINNRSHIKGDFVLKRVRKLRAALKKGES